MKLGRFRRRSVAALVAAYAVALQALLSAFVPIAAVVPPGPLICSHDLGDGSGTPVRHDLPCTALCAAMAQSLSGPLPPTVTVATIAPLGLSGLLPAGNWLPPNIAFASNHAPRGPPLA